MGYADPKTLLGGPEKAYPCGALEEFKPTLMAGVPKVPPARRASATHAHEVQHSMPRARLFHTRV